MQSIEDSFLEAPNYEGFSQGKKRSARSFVVLTYWIRVRVRLSATKLSSLSRITRRLTTSSRSHAADSPTDPDMTYLDSAILHKHGSVQ